MQKEIDVVDVHVTSVTERVDAFTQYPLLDGTKKYTVEITEFVCPISQDALPSLTNSVDNLMFEIRRKYPGVAPPHDHSSLVTPPEFNSSGSCREYLPTVRTLHTEISPISKK